MASNRPKILLVGMIDSVHLGRWISQFKESSIDLVLFPSSPHRRIHPIIRELVRAEHNSLRVTVAPSLMRWFALPLSALDLVLDNRSRAMILRRLISKNSFDAVHLQELQHAGYIFLRANSSHRISKIVVTNWGSDIYWFERFPKHRSRISQLLKQATHYSAECHRDIGIVRKMGYRNAIFPVVPNGGGVRLDQVPINLTQTSLRRQIIIKGYTGSVGRATDAIRACESVADCLSGYEVLVYSASLRARLRLLKLRYWCGVKTRVIKKRTPQEEMLRNFARSRIYIGVSLSDGISTSLLEAMATGCYPIQTSTACADEWISPESGSIVAPQSIRQIADAIRQAITDDDRVDAAAIINRSTIESRGSSAAVSMISRNFYEQILEG